MTEFYQFDHRMQVLKKFMEDVERLELAIASISEDTGRPCLHGEIIDSYIELLSSSFVNGHIIFPFVFEGEWGKKGEIKSIKELYKKLII